MACLLTNSFFGFQMYGNTNFMRSVLCLSGGEKTLPTCQALDRTKVFMIRTLPRREILRSAREPTRFSAFSKTLFQFSSADLVRFDVKMIPRNLVSGRFHLIGMSGQRCFPNGWLVAIPRVLVGQSRAPDPDSYFFKSSKSG